MDFAGTESGFPRDVMGALCLLSLDLALDLGNPSLVLGRIYLTRQAAALLRFANSTSDPKLAAALVERAAKLKSQADEQALSQPDPSPYAPDVEDDTR